MRFWGWRERWILFFSFGIFLLVLIFYRDLCHYMRTNEGLRLDLGSGQPDHMMEKVIIHKHGLNFITVEASDRPSLNHFVSPFIRSISTEVNFGEVVPIYFTEGLYGGNKIIFCIRICPHKLISLKLELIQLMPSTDVRLFSAMLINMSLSKITPWISLIIAWLLLLSIWLVWYLRKDPHSSWR